MAILITEGADPLSDASMASSSGSVVRNAQSDAGRVLRLELTRYCRRELHGRSFLIAGHRGAGKTTMVADALDKVLRLSRRTEEGLLRPLPIFLHGPSLFEVEAGEPHATDARHRRGKGEPTESQRMAAQANVALKQIILGIHRAVAKEFGHAYRRRMVESRFAAWIVEPTDDDVRFGPTAPAPANPRRAEPRPYADRVGFAELAAQFELELVENPTAARLREFWDMAQALQCGVLFGDSTAVDQGARELVALNGLCNAHQRISGEISAQDTTARGDESVGESLGGVDVRGDEFFKPLASVVAGAAVAGGAAAGAHGLGWALGAGLVTALGSTLAFRSSTSRTTKVGRQIDTTFIPDLSLKTLDRILPTLLQHLRDAGLAPVLVVDELDKVRGLPERLVGMIHFLKKLVAENVFTCLLTDRGYLEHLRVKDRDSAYGKAYSYFSHPLLVTYQPADFDGFLDKLLQVDRAGASAPAAPSMSHITPYEQTTLSSDADTVDLEVLKWVLRHRSQMHALALTRELASLRGEDNVLQIAPGVVRSEYTYRIDITFQVAIELQLAQPHVRAWLRQRPDMSQTLLDVLYFPSRQWFKGHDTLARGADGVDFHRHLVGRMNLAELAAEGSVERAVDVADALSDDDRTFFDAVLDDLLRFLGPSTDVVAATKRWEQLPPRDTAVRAEPGLPVLQAMLLGDRSLLAPVAGVPGQAQEYGWRYLPSGVERPSMVVAAGEAPMPSVPPVAPVRPAAASPPGVDPFEASTGLRAGPRLPAAAAFANPFEQPVAAPRAAGQSLDDMSAHEASDYIGRVLENLSALLFPVDATETAPSLGARGVLPARKIGPVFETLCDRMRVLPTTPAWPRVQSAIDNLALIRGGGGNQSTRIEDIRAVQGFAEMLKASRIALHRALVMAAYCGAAGLETSIDRALNNGMDALSSGQRFAMLDAEGVTWAMERLATAVQATGSARLSGPAERAKSRKLDDHGLVEDVKEAFRVGSEFFVQSPDDAFTTAAWESLELRLQRFLATGESPPADLEEVLCAVRVKGPATLVTLDLQAMTMQGWTSALMRAASATLDSRADGQDIPLWLIGCALNRLGAATVTARPLARLVEWALGRFSKDEQQAAAVFRAIHVRADNAPPPEVGNRVAVCVTSDLDAPMAKWVDRPRRGLGFVAYAAHVEALLGGPLKVLQLSALMAVAQGPGVRIPDREMRRLASGSRLLRGPLWVYRRRVPQMLEPALIDPQTVDDVLEQAPPSAELEED